MKGEYLHKPCPECPFLRTEGAVRLMSGRVHELTDLMLGNGGEFSCHKTTKTCEQAGCDDGDCEERHTDSDARHCAGALIFAEKNGNQTQMMRIAGRLGLYDPRKLQDQDKVFDTAEEMLETAIDRNRPRRRQRR